MAIERIEMSEQQSLQELIAETGAEALEREQAIADVEKAYREEMADHAATTLRAIAADEIIDFLWVQISARGVVIDSLTHDMRNTIQASVSRVALGKRLAAEKKSAAEARAARMTEARLKAEAARADYERQQAGATE